MTGDNCLIGPAWYGLGPGNQDFTASEIGQFFNNFRGVGGVNPSAPPTQDDANTWAQTQIDGGHWWDVVKPALDAMIRAGTGNMDMVTLGITGNPPFDGDFGQVELGEAMSKPSIMAAQLTGPPAISWAEGEANRDWIRSTPLRWNLNRKVSK